MKKQQISKKDTFSLKSTIILAIAVLAIGISLTLIAYSKYKYLGEDKIYAEAKFINMTKTIGFNLDNDALKFGSISKSVTMERRLIITNTRKMPILISITFQGNISQYIGVSDNNFELQPQERKELVFTVSNPGEGYAPQGKYEGYAVITYIRP